ncbi:hypothetical protein BpHYR1_051734 [Brachionus plicatilis]|uniref:Uncharacterized protein n=1 Tax=Brachionus plicatilis TaxID=10195 RepID=A0A3M7REZ1_BRAPC|nr:hypothetical protein BpHYR1_051734 [Brachionus plicatilis]
MSPRPSMFGESWVEWSGPVSEAAKLIAVAHNELAGPVFGLELGGHVSALVGPCVIEQRVVEQVTDVSVLSGVIYGVVVMECVAERHHYQPVFENGTVEGGRVASAHSDRVVVVDLEYDGRVHSGRLVHSGLDVFCDRLAGRTVRQNGADVEVVVGVRTESVDEPCDADGGVVARRRSNAQH